MTIETARYGQDVCPHCRIVAPAQFFPPNPVTVALCPVCVGKGKVETGFYEIGSIRFYGTATADSGELCRSCDGKGYVR